MSAALMPSDISHTNDKESGVLRNSDSLYASLSSSDLSPTDNDPLTIGGTNSCEE